MSKQVKLIAGAIIVIIIVAIGAFMMMSKSKAPQTTTNITQENTQQQAVSKGSIKSLIGSGKNVTCTMIYPNGSGIGTVYVAGEKARGDFMMAADAKNIESHMIQDGEFGYFWTGTQGTKMKIDTTATPAATASANQQQSADLNQEVDMSCSNWEVDNSKFTTPTDVKFMDLTQKGTCDTLAHPDQKAACISALGN